MKTNLITSTLFGALAFVTLPSTSIAKAQEAITHKLPRLEVSETHNIQQKFIDVYGSKIAYLEIGQGNPVIYIHGNPTSSYLWRNVMPHVSQTHTNIAHDFIKVLKFQSVSIKIQVSLLVKLNAQNIKTNSKSIARL